MPGDITLHMCTINENLMMYGSWDMEHDRHNFLSFCNIFCTLTLPPSTPPSNSRNQSSENMKKKLGDIITLHMCTINDNHMMYGSWDMECGRHNFLSFWTIFCPYTPLTTPKIKIFNKWKKKTGDIIILHKSTKIMIMCYTVPEIGRVTGVIFIFHFGLFFTLLPPNNLKNQNF